jgi:hypothetical protein
VKRNRLITLIIASFLLVLFIPINSVAQEAYVRWNTFDIGSIANMFANDGEISQGGCWYQTGRHPAFEYPIGSGKEYGMAIGFYVGARRTVDFGGENPEDKPFVDMCLDEYKDNWDDFHWKPYGPGPYENEVDYGGMVFDFVGTSERAAMSDDLESWPSTWPSVYPHPDYMSSTPLLVGSEGWPGIGPGGERLADQESFTVAYCYNPIAEVPPERWLKLQAVIRGFGWRGKIAEDYLFWSHEITNIGTSPIDSTYFGMWVDYDFVWRWDWEFFDNGHEAMAYDSARQMVYAWNYEGRSETMSGFPVEPTAYAGIIFLKTPKDLGITTFSSVVYGGDYCGQTGNNIESEMYYTDVLNEDDLGYDTNWDGIDDTWEWPDGTISSEFALTNDAGGGYFFLNSGPFTLDSAETETLTVCTVVGADLGDLRKNADYAITLYNTGWVLPQPPPAPAVIGAAGDRVDTLYWGKYPTEGALDFEGYRIYRSVDNGATWGEREITNPNGTVVGYVPLAQYDKVDGIKGFCGHPDATWLNFGDDTGFDGIRNAAVDSTDTLNPLYYMLVDRDVINGLTYRYNVAAYDTGNAPPFPPVENAPIADPTIPGDNVIELTPLAPLSTTNLDEVKVVPNPYIATNEWETTPFERRIEFTHLPLECDIRIYNVAGELVRILEHRNGTSMEPWNIRNSANQEISPGLYFYHIASIDPDIGEKTGKFVIIK